MAFDKVDRRILHALQNDSRLSVAELAERIHLSSSACHRRMKRLEQDGVIAGYGARLDRARLGYLLEVFVEISLESQNEQKLDAFERAVRDCPEVLECHLMAGDADYMIRVAAIDTAHYERIHRERLSRLPYVARMKSNFIIRTIQAWSGYYVEGM
jgi:DNA-binding Lrp family transcriptional regulator